MAQNTTVTLVANTSTLITDGDVTSARVQNLSGYDVDLQATAGATAPASWAGAIRLGPGQTLAADLTLAQLWPGVAGANRLHARSGFGVTLSVSHA